jgi:hypothetical protein
MVLVAYLLQLGRTPTDKLNELVAKKKAYQRPPRIKWRTAAVNTAG